MKQFCIQLLKTIALIALWAALLIPCYTLCRYFATEHYPSGDAVHQWFQVVVYDGADRTVAHPDRLPPGADIVRTPFNTGMGFYLNAPQNGVYESGSEIGLGMARSRYRIEGGTVQPVAFVYEGMHNVMMPAALLAFVLTWIAAQLMARWHKLRGK